MKKIYITTKNQKYELIVIDENKEKKKNWLEMYFTSQIVLDILTPLMLRNKAKIKELKTNHPGVNKSLAPYIKMANKYPEKLEDLFKMIEYELLLETVIVKDGEELILKSEAVFSDNQELSVAVQKAVLSFLNSAFPL